MIDAIWPQVGQAWAADVQVFGEAPEWMVRFQFESLPGSAVPKARMALASARCLTSNSRSGDTRRRDERIPRA